MTAVRIAILIALFLLPAHSPADEKTKPEPAAKVPADHVAKSKEGLRLFKDHVREILSTHCLDCHGGKSTKADFNLATRDGLFDGGYVEKQSSESYLMELVRHEADPAMPFKADKLKDDQIALIAKWIDLGAPYDKPLVEGAADKSDQPMQVTDEDRQFWSFQPLAQVAVPTSDRDSWSRTPVDRFVSAKLQEKGIVANDEADRRTLIRRAYLDLIGMPPSASEVAEFVADQDAKAFEKVIDRLLQSQHYGERWARHWMDVARFAESTGFEHDYDRKNAYHYRDFLIQAFNDNMPWDQMVRWQLAGDELAPSEPLALMATGFMAAGVFPTQLTEAEFESARYDELDDIVATTGVAFLGLSIGCARCHDHKFDPFPTRDYYGLAATFATAIRSERDVEFDRDQHQAKLKAWEAEHAKRTKAFDTYVAEEFEPRFARWLAEPELPEDFGASNWQQLDGAIASSRDGTTLTLQDDGAWLASGKQPKNDEYTIEANVTAGAAALRIEALTHDSLPRKGPGRAGNGNFALGDLIVEAQFETGGEKKKQRVKLTAPRATHQQNTGDLSVASSIDGDPNKTGWAVDFGGIGKDQAAIFQFSEPLTDDARLSIRMRFHVNTVHSFGRFRLSTSGDPKSDFELGKASSSGKLVAAMKVLAEGDVSKLSDSQRQTLRDWLAARDPQWQKQRSLLDEHAAARPKANTRPVLIYSEGVKPMKHHADGRGYPHFYPDVHLLSRGDVRQKQEVMQAGFVSVLQGERPFKFTSTEADSSGLSYRRSRLASWLTDADAGAGHLLARVIVNRLWQHHLGRGIVATPNDFGFQGARPTHPELLDWLAAELIRGGWRLKPIHKLIMSSSVYQQSSQTDEQRSAADIDNLLLWRFVPRRLEGEAIRDSLLSVSGMLDRSMYGSGSLSESMRRRSVYFTVKRSGFVPMMQIFDWPEHLVSIGQRSRTAIAPQALALMNGPQVRSYAESLASRIAKDHESAEARVRAAYLEILTREPDAAETQLAAAFMNAQAARYASDSDGAGRAIVDLCQALFCSNEFLYLP